MDNATTEKIVKYDYMTKVEKNIKSLNYRYIDRLF